MARVRMKDRERFIELRAEGVPYAECATQLGISKPTLLELGRALQLQIANAKALRLEALVEKYAISKVKRIEVFGARLAAILAELDRRDLTEVPTTALLKLALDYGARLREEAEPLTLQREADRWADAVEVETWEA